MPIPPPPPLPDGTVVAHDPNAQPIAPAAPPALLPIPIPAPSGPIPPPPPLPDGTVVPHDPNAKPIAPPKPAAAPGGPGAAPPSQLPPPSAAGVGKPKIPETPKGTKIDTGVVFPTKTVYFEAKDDVEGNLEKGQLKMKRGAMVAIYKTEHADWWLGKVGDQVGWVPASNMAKLDANAPGRRPHIRSNSGRDWEYKQEGFMQAQDIDSDKTDFSVTQAKTFEHQGSKVTAFFVQVEGVKKLTRGKGDIWVVAKTLKAFNRLRVAWEEDFGANTIPVEPPLIRWADCSPKDWELLRSSALKEFLEEVKRRPSLKTSQDLKHFLTTDRVNLSGGMITSSTMKPYLDSWVKTSSEPSTTQNIPALPTNVAIPQPGGKPNAPAKKAAIPGLKPSDEEIGIFTGRRPKLRRSDTFAQISALAAVTKQESLLEFGRRGWTEAGIKLQLLTQGGQAASLSRRSERNIFNKYYRGEVDGSRALTQRGSYNQMKFETRFNLEKIMYGRMENLSRETNTKYAVYASKQKKSSEEKQEEKENGGEGDAQAGGAKGGKPGMPPKAGKQATAPKGHQKKNTMFVLDMLAQRLDQVGKLNEIQTAYGASKESGLERCQYMSHAKGRFTMPLPAQLMALQEIKQTELEAWLEKLVKPANEKEKLERLKQMDAFLEDKRLRCNQLAQLLLLVSDPDEKLMVALTCCPRLTDAAEAEEQGLFDSMQDQVDGLNLERIELCVQALAAEAQAEEASRSSRKAARDVHSDVQRQRKALRFLSQASDKIKAGQIKRAKFEQLKERLDAAADAAHEEYEDAIRDAKPVTGFADEAIRWAEHCEQLFEDLDEMGTHLAKQEKVQRPSPSKGKPLPPVTIESITQDAMEVLHTIANNAFEMATRAADNARFDVKTALEEVHKAEKIMKRVVMEGRRAYQECNTGEGMTPQDFVPDDCPFASWSGEMEELKMQNLAKFVKEASYRCFMDSSAFRGTDDSMMMGMALAKVQLIEDLKRLKQAKQAAIAAEEDKKNRAASKVSPEKQKTKKRGGGAATTADRLSPPRSLSPRKAPSSPQNGMQTDPNFLSDNNPSDDDGEDDESVSISSSSDEEDSVFGSDLDAGDNDDLAAMRQSVKAKAEKRQRQGASGVKGRNGRRGSDAARVSVEGLRRNDRMRKMLIQDSLGTHRSIGRKNITETKVIDTPRGGGPLPFSEEDGFSEEEEHGEEGA